MTVDKVTLKALAEGMKGWDKMTECWPSDENGPDWQVGRLDEDDNRWPLLTVDTEQYDQEQDAPKVAQYYAAANPVAVLALLAENDRNAKNAAEWEAASLHWMAERDQLKAKLAELEARVILKDVGIDHRDALIREVLDAFKLEPDGSCINPGRDFIRPFAEKVALCGVKKTGDYKGTISRA